MESTIIAAIIAAGGTVVAATAKVVIDRLGLRAKSDRAMGQPRQDLTKHRPKDVPVLPSDSAEKTSLNKAGRPSLADVNVEQLTKILIEAAVNSAGRYSVIYADVDGLLGVNKVHGDAAGDEVLRRTGALLEEIVKPHEVYRLVDQNRAAGGDQFVAILPNSILTEAFEVAEQCRRSFAAYQWSAIALDLYVSCSWAVAEWLGPEEPAMILLRAIHGVKLAKTAGGNVVVEAPRRLPTYLSRDPLAQVSSHLS